jgi:hypothetical protein
MAIVSGELIRNTDFSSIVGNYSSNVAFPNQTSAENCLNALYGVGGGDRGLGQVPFGYTGTGDGVTSTFDIGITTSIESVTATVNGVAASVAMVSGKLVTLASVPPSESVVTIYIHIAAPISSDKIFASSWKYMRNAMDDLNTFFGQSNDLLPEESNFQPGDTYPTISSVYSVYSVYSDTSSYNWQAAVKIIDQNRKNIPPSSLAPPVVSLTNSRNTPWPDLVSLKFSVNFQDEDHARWFFNAGGAISIAPSFVPTDPLDTHSSSWRTMLSGSNPPTSNFAGSFTIRADTATRDSGSGGAFQSAGYYTLRQQTTQILNFRVADLDNSLINSTGIYKDYVNNYYTASASVKNVIGANRGNGNAITVELIFNDVWGTSYQPVYGNLSVNVSVTKPHTLAITSPTFTVDTDLSTGGGDIYYLFVSDLDANTNNYDLLTAAQNSGYSTTSGIPLRATVTVRSNIIIGSTSAATYAFTLPALPTNSEITIRNYGYIMGKGGNGGNGTAHTVGGSGNAGGPALRLQYACTLFNSGVIGGGGGGGGGGSATVDEQTYDDPGGAGGGGAGSTPGNGADGGPHYGTYAGANGTLLIGGIGGQPEAHAGSSEYWLAGNGGKGGDLGQAGITGQNGNNNNGYGGGPGGTAGIAITGESFILTGSIEGDIRGSTI